MLKDLGNGFLQWSDEDSSSVQTVESVTDLALSLDRWIIDEENIKIRNSRFNDVQEIVGDPSEGYKTFNKLFDIIDEHKEECKIIPDTSDPFEGQICLSFCGELQPDGTTSKHEPYELNKNSWNPETKQLKNKPQNKWELIDGVWTDTKIPLSLEEYLENNPGFKYLPGILWHDIKCSYRLFFKLVQNGFAHRVGIKRNTNDQSKSDYILGEFYDIEFPKPTGKYVTAELTQKVKELLLSLPGVNDIGYYAISCSGTENNLRAHGFIPLDPSKNYQWQDVKASMISRREALTPLLGEMVDGACNDTCRLIYSAVHQDWMTKYEIWNENPKYSEICPNRKIETKKDFLTVRNPNGQIPIDFNKPTARNLRRWVLQLIEEYKLSELEMIEKISLEEFNFPISFNSSASKADDVIEKYRARNISSGKSNTGLCASLKDENDLIALYDPVNHVGFNLTTARYYWENNKIPRGKKLIEEVKWLVDKFFPMTDWAFEEPNYSAQDLKEMFLKDHEKRFFKYEPDATSSADPLYFVYENNEYAQVSFKKLLQRISDWFYREYGFNLPVERLKEVQNELMVVPQELVLTQPVPKDWHLIRLNDAVVKICNQVDKKDIRFMPNPFTSLPYDYKPELATGETYKLVVDLLTQNMDETGKQWISKLLPLMILGVAIRTGTFLYIHGDPGCGKSTIKTFIEAILKHTNDSAEDQMATLSGDAINTINKEPNKNTSHASNKKNKIMCIEECSRLKIDPKLIKEIVGEFGKCYHNLQLEAKGIDWFEYAVIWYFLIISEDSEVFSSVNCSSSVGRRIIDIHTKAVEWDTSRGDITQLMHDATFREKFVMDCLALDIEGIIQEVITEVKTNMEDRINEFQSKKDIVVRWIEDCLEISQDRHDDKSWKMTSKAMSEFLKEYSGYQATSKDLAGRTIMDAIITYARRRLGVNLDKDVKLNVYVGCNGQRKKRKQLEGLHGVALNLNKYHPDNFDNYREMTSFIPIEDNSNS